MPPTDLSVLQIRRDGEEDAPRRGGRIWLSLAVLLAIAGAGWVAWRSEWLPRSTPEVRVARPRLIQPGGAEEVLAATGYIVPQLRSVVSARISGRLEWLGVDEGSRVKAGEVIARLSGDDLAALVAEARASLAQAAASLEQARASAWEAQREQERQRSLLEQGITTTSDDDAAKRGYDVARAGVTAAEESLNAWRARLVLAEANYDKTIIRAPFDGVVIAKSAEIGEMVAAGAFSGQPTGGAIVTVADFGTLEMEADVNESNLSRLATGQSALVSVDAVPDRKYRGVLRQIVPAADRQKAIVQAKVKLIDSDDRLMPDMSARVAFLSQQISEEAVASPPRVFVPSTAVRLEGGSPFVLVVREERAVRLPISLGEARGELREVLSGLKGDETLIVAGADGLEEGSRVRIAS